MSSEAGHVAAEALSAYSDGDLGAEEAARIEAHLASCEACSRTLEELARTRELLRQLHRHPAPERFAARVEGRIRRRSRGRFFVSRWQGTAPYLGAAVVLVILAALYFFTQAALEVRDADTGRTGQQLQTSPQQEMDAAD